MTTKAHSVHCNSKMYFPTTGSWGDCSCGADLIGSGNQPTSAERADEGPYFVAQNQIDGDWDIIDRKGVVGDSYEDEDSARAECLRLNAKFGETDGNPATTQSSGDNRGSEAQKSSLSLPPDHPPLSIEKARQLVIRWLCDCETTTENEHSSEVCKQRGIDAIDDLIDAVRADERQNAHLYAEPTIIKRGHHGCNYCTYVPVWAESLPLDQQEIERAKILDGIIARTLAALGADEWDTCDVLARQRMTEITELKTANRNFQSQIERLQSEVAELTAIVANSTRDLLTKTVEKYKQQQGEAALATLRAPLEKKKEKDFGAGLIHQIASPLAGTEPRPDNSGAFLDCGWACSKCVKAGAVRPWMWATESNDEALRRHVSDTRSRCVSGCLYSAREAK